MATDQIALEELRRRDQIQAQLGHILQFRAITPGYLRELGIYRGGEGIFVDKPATSKITPDGVTVSLLHLGG